MILPKKKTDHTKTVGSVAFTLLIAVGGYSLLVYLNAPDQRPQREVYREISMTNIKEIPRFEPEVPELEPQAVETTVGKNQTRTQAPTPKPKETPRRINLSQSLANRSEPDLTENRQFSRTRGEEDTEQSALELEASDGGRQGGFATLRDHSSSLRAGSSRIRGSDGEEKSGLDIESGSGGGGAGYRPELSSNDMFQPDAGRNNNADGAPEIGLRELEALGSNYSDLDDVLAGLLEWMKNNPAELPRPVQRLMAENRWDPAYLTSLVSINIEEADYSIYLMVKEELFEVHILIVRENQATYLVDRNFQKESNSLRVGGVQQNEGLITMINSQMEAASNNKAKKFYQIFLTWWESVQQEVSK
ncbi:MAG: hypothetical protein WD267_04810 [Balneolales bacterium]